MKVSVLFMHYNNHDHYDDDDPSIVLWKVANGRYSSEAGINHNNAHKLHIL
jgi:hypothetical protein